LTLTSDEVLYHAKLHPEQYSNTFSPAQLKQLHASILYVCNTAVGLLGDSSKFPDEWMFNHRWGKGKKDAPTTLPNGEKITFLKVGGRTSCVVPSVQKKTGAVAGDLKEGSEGKKVNGDAVKEDGKKPTSKKRKIVEKIDEIVDAIVEPVSKAVTGKERKKTEPSEVTDEDESKSKKRKIDAPAKAPAKSKSKAVKEEVKEEETAPAARRRSGRVSKG
jgi:formamidopyrimidine-DNA glycosylase